MCFLHAATTEWIKTKNEPNFTRYCGALSVGLSQDHILLDIDYDEDSTCDADVNFVMTGSGAVIEVQGATESKPFDWNVIELYA